MPLAQTERQRTAAPATANWEVGARVQDGGLILPVTAIATMVNGHYPNHPHGNHAAFFLRKEGACIVVMDQWASDITKPTISSRRICPKGKHANGTYVDPSNNAEAYKIVELVCPAKVSAVADVKGVPDDWSVSQRADGLWVDGLIVTDGPLADRGDLQPEDGKKGAVTWDLSGDHSRRSYWASCSYGKWLVLVSKKLPDGILRCSSGPLKVDSSNNPVMRLECK